MYQEDWLLIKEGQKHFFNLISSILITLGLVFQGGYSFAQNSSSISIEQIDEAQQRYTGDIARRFAAWKKLILTYQNKAITNKLKVTNDFFNQFTFQYDDAQGHDYWKTPEELIASGVGDCEDFSIAKYFTLLALGVPMSSLRITYVKSLQLNRAHMVLAYYPTPEAEPLVLDNLISRILPASQRPDLTPVYSFNGRGLWLAKQRGRDKLLGDSNRLSKWQNLIQRMQKR
ncbi:transglutaminase-like cysteine peptidase [Legionella hackeliae]|uniref:Periplasmic protein n=1 Tax=Legionella hackeliae TaxID=449 RepID=A0A0A8UUH3_LEGHA|nr:transglutaminase-like cysteine peptidase [Legionella hackeliae]KTD15488.1 periplasmic protein [Legionella hackeliae]CEK11141.1 conserved protein of unknown function [Legionella hackeliae]STX47899.1 periplasmic protein [Legionella hackeliae]